jgi:hypothetical protein
MNSKVISFSSLFGANPDGLLMCRIKKLVSRSCNGKNPHILIIFPKSQKSNLKQTMRAHSEKMVKCPLLPRHYAKAD